MPGRGRGKNGFCWNLDVQFCRMEVKSPSVLFICLFLSRANSSNRPVSGSKGILEIKTFFVSHTGRPLIMFKWTIFFTVFQRRRKDASSDSRSLKVEMGEFTWKMHFNEVISHKVPNSQTECENLLVISKFRDTPNRTKINDKTVLNTSENILCIPWF